MSLHSKERERWDWGLIIFIIPIGILLLLVVGQIAIRILPHWSLFANMNSNLDPDTAAPRPLSFFQPILPQILTPMAWADSYLTPVGEISFPPFIVINPGTPTPTSEIPTAQASSTPVPPPVTGTATVVRQPTSTPPVVIISPTSTQEPKPKDTATSLPTPTQTASQVPTNSPIPTVPTNTPITPSPTPTGFPSAPPSFPQLPVPPEVGDTPDDASGEIPPGNYIIVDVSSNPVVVSSTPDGFYDFVLYEYYNSAPEWDAVLLDFMIVGIISDTDLSDEFVYYQVLNWGDNIRDINTNVDTNILPMHPLDTGCIANLECDNRRILPANLYPYPGTGIQIDVDTASSEPPPGVYNYIIIISPLGGDNDAPQIDAITVVEN